MRSRSSIFFFAFVFFIISIIGGSYRYCISWDKAGYYLYLPAVFIYHDVATLDLYEQVDQGYRPTGDWKWYGIYQDSVTHRRFNKYPVGVAVLESPFFLVALAYCHITNTPVFYGYSAPFQMAVCIAMFFWELLGLLYLRKLLLAYFGDGITAITLLLLLFGTNIFFYTVYDPGMSHPFSFGLFCLLLYATDRWYKTKVGSYAVAIGIIMGMITITRPTNALAILVPLLWSAPATSLLVSRWSFFRAQYKAIIIAILAFFALLMVQLSYWQYTTGRWIIFSYKGEGFDFAHPHIWLGLTSYDKGWLVYTPVAIFALIGFAALRKWHRQLVVPLLLFIMINTYIVFSWRFWQYGGGFSTRALIESYALLSFPMAAGLQWLCTGKRSIQLVVGILLFSFVVLNVFQSWQVHSHILPGIWINKKEYWQVFGRLSPVQ